MPGTYHACVISMNDHTNNEWSEDRLECQHVEKQLKYDLISCHWHSRVPVTVPASLIQTQSLASATRKAGEDGPLDPCHSYRKSEWHSYLACSAWLNPRLCDHLSLSLLSLLPSPFSLPPSHCCLLPSLYVWHSIFQISKEQSRKTSWEQPLRTANKLVLQGR